MADSRRSETVSWFSPDPRAIIPLETARCPRSVRQKIRRGVFEVRCDTDFPAVIRACAAPRRDSADTWINLLIEDAYIALHRLGQAHSVEAWREGRLVGGLYGVGLGGAFFGESMFHRPDLGGTDASKVCLAHLIDRLRRDGCQLLDVQMITPVTEMFGAVEVPRPRYLRLLRSALAAPATW